MEQCWDADPASRPEFLGIIDTLEAIAADVRGAEAAGLGAGAGKGV
jgi:hypothetical protein